MINDVERNLLNLKNVWENLKKMGAIGINANNFEGIIEVHCRGRKSPLFAQTQGEEIIGRVLGDIHEVTKDTKDTMGLKVFYIYKDPEGGE